MSGGKFVRTTAFALTAVFSQLAMPGGAMAGEQNDITGTWENESIGVVDIQPCENDTSKFCGYLKEASPKAMEEFELKVSDPSADVSGMVVINNLQPNEEGSKFTDGKFQNTDNSNAQDAELSIEFDGEVMNVRASIGWFGEDFAFNRVEAPEQVAKITPEKEISEDVVRIASVTPKPKMG